MPFEVEFVFDPYSRPTNLCQYQLMDDHQNDIPNSATNDNRTRLRLFVEYDLEDGHAVPANQDQRNYLRKVMRRKDGDMVALFNGRHGEWLARIAYESKSRCVLIVE